MFRQFSSLLGTAALATTGFFLASSVAPAHEGGGHGGGHGGGGHGGGHAGGHQGGYYHHAGYAGGHQGGYYHGGYYGAYRPYGYGAYRGVGYGYGLYRPYYGYGLGGYGLGGLGLGGLGLGGYGLGGYGLGGYGGGGYGSYLPYGGGYGYGAGAPSVVVNVPGTSVNPPAGPPAGQTPPPPDNAAHLQLIVSENAEVQFDGSKTTQVGPAREFVSPPLNAGQVFTYKITVRGTDPSGRPIDDTRNIRVHANDWVR